MSMFCVSMSICVCMCVYVCLCFCVCFSVCLSVCFLFYAYMCVYVLVCMCAYVDVCDFCGLSTHNDHTEARKGGQWYDPSGLLATPDPVTLEIQIYVALCCIRK